MSEIAIIGAYECKHGILSDRTLRDMISEVGNGAIIDAKIDRNEIQAVYVGNYAGNAEKMYMVHDPDERDMVTLSAKYLQHSVVIAEGGSQRLVFTNGPHKGRTKAGRGWKIATSREGQFTEVNTTDGEIVRFTLQF